MFRFKGFLKSLLPPIIVSVFRKKEKKQPKTPGFWSGDYKSWEAAKQHCTGYDSKLILEKCKAALLKVKRGEVVYERDSVIFDNIEYSWGLLAGLERAALENDGKLCVLDFGGSLGSSYYQNKGFLSPVTDLQWCIVEQPHFVNCGRENFEDVQLKFYHTIEECMEKHSPDVLLLSSVLQYLEQPYEWIEKFIALQIPFIILDRTAFIQHEKDILTVQRVPKEIYEASYPAWFFAPAVISKFTNYKLIGLFESFCDNKIVLNGDLPAVWQGYHLKLSVT
jgi:putative methyltransferase (TIGR04325 family)